MIDVKETKKVLLALLLGSMITTPIVMLAGNYFLELQDEYYNVELCGILGFDSVLFLFGILLLTAFATIVVLTTLATIMNLKKSNLCHQITWKLTNKINVKLLDPSKADMTTFYFVDDERLVMKRKVPNAVYFLAGIIFVISLVPFLVDVKNDEVYLGDGAWLFLMFGSIVNVLYNLRYSMCTVTFNRLRSTVTVPAFFMILSKRTIPFRKINVNAYNEQLDIAIPFRLPNITIVGEPTQEWWNFYIWYMDKNRPLPTCALFDAYREKDYLRRRSEGFPAPLYESFVPTPEWEGAAEKYGDTDAEKRTEERYVHFSDRFKAN